MTRKYYERRFIAFPDVVTLKDFRIMLGGIAEATALKLMHKNIVQHYFIRRTYYIPKQCVIDYLLSDHYAYYRLKLKHGVK